MSNPGNYWYQKVVLVTGGSSGIGLAAAKLLAAAGAHVWLTARRPELLACALAELEACRLEPTQKFGYTPADVSRADQVEKVVKEVSAYAGAPEVAINSAGVTQPGYFHDLSLDVFEELMKINYFGTVTVSKAVLPAMQARRSGHIINLSSMAGYMGVFGYTAYGASKFAVSGFSETLRAEMRPYGIRVSVAFPPDTDTPQLAYEEPFKPAETRAISGNAKALSAEHVAHAILKQAARGAYQIFPGTDARLFYIANNLVPKRWVFAILDQMAAGAKKNKE